MDWKSECVNIQLEQPPVILRMSGCSSHGRQRPERYCLDKFWCLNLFQGEGVLRIGNTDYPFADGYAGITWPGQEMTYFFERRTVKTWVHFIPAVVSGEHTVPIPVMQNLGVDFVALRSDLQALPSLYRSHPGCATARFWDILWRLSAGAASEGGRNHGLPEIVTRAMDAIDISISEALDIAVLAEELSISQSHLNRLFKAATGGTVGHYIQTRRMELALHLLRHTTLPIKRVASQVGLPDAQHFNKSVRRYFSASPSALRRQGGA